MDPIIMFIMGFSFLIIITLSIVNAVRITRVKNSSSKNSDSLSATESRINKAMAKSNSELVSQMKLLNSETENEIQVDMLNNMDKIQKAQVVIDSKQDSSISANEDDIFAMDSNIANMKGETLDLNNKVVNLDTLMNENSSSIGSLSKDYADINNSFNSLSAQVSNDIEALNTYQFTDQAIQAELEETTKTNKSNINKHQNRLIEVEGVATKNTSKIADNKEDIQTNNDKYVKAMNEVGANTTLIETNMETNNNEHSLMNKNLDVQEERVETNEETMYNNLLNINLNKKNIRGFDTVQNNNDTDLSTANINVLEKKMNKFTESTDRRLSDFERDIDVVTSERLIDSAKTQKFREETVSFYGGLRDDLTDDIRENRSTIDRNKNNINMMENNLSQNVGSIADNKEAINVNAVTSNRITQTLDKAVSHIDGAEQEIYNTRK